MNKIKIDFILHWLMAVVFALLLISGLTLMGAKFGWFMQYNLALADYIHRTMAAAFVVLAFAAMVVEAIRLSRVNPENMPWHFVSKKSGVGLFTLAAILLFTLSGIFLWLCKEFSPAIIAFAFVIHDLMALISIPVILWHIYEKSHGLPRDWGVAKDVQKKLV